MLTPTELDIDVDLGLRASLFKSVIRSGIESELEKRFGPPGGLHEASTRRTDRPRAENEASSDLERRHEEAPETRTT